jgi:RNA recognition motif-containing protein
MKLYVGNLSFDTTQQDLEQIFGEIGTVESSNIIEDRDTGRSRGFAFVEMSSKEEGQNAIARLNGKEIGGRILTVNEAKPREDRGGSGVTEAIVAAVAVTEAAVRAGNNRNYKRKSLRQLLKAFSFQHHRQKK